MITILIRLILTVMIIWTMTIGIIMNNDNNDHNNNKDNFNSYDNEDNNSKDNKNDDKEDKNYNLRTNK